MYTVEEFEDSLAERWDDFVLKESVNGTVFHTRRFLSYHPEGRFEDASIVVRRGSDLVAVVPACRDEDAFFSHSGSSYGGPVVDEGHHRVRELSSLLETIDDYYGGRLGMRLAPSIFSQVGDDALVFLCGRSMKIRRELGVYRPLRDVEDFAQGIRSNRTATSLRQLYEGGFESKAARSDEEYRAFHAMLTQNLERHGVEPTHTESELLLLRERLGDLQMLLLGEEDDLGVTSGTWIVKASPRAWHTFYIAKDYERGHDATVPGVLVGAMEVAREAGAEHLNLGICTEDGGAVLNLGLFRFKESLGGRTVIRHTLVPS